MNELVEELKGDLQTEDARYAYADTVTNAFVTAQIKALREDRDLTQTELANLIGTKQSGVSRLLQKDYSSWKVETLRKLARAFGVRLRIKFEEFGTLTEEIKGFDEKSLVPRKFEDDPIFNSHHDEEAEQAEDVVLTKWRVNGIAQLANASAAEISAGDGWRERLDLATYFMGLENSDTFKGLKRLADPGSEASKAPDVEDQPAGVNDPKARPNRGSLLHFDRRRGPSRNRGWRSRASQSKRHYGT